MLEGLSKGMPNPFNSRDAHAIKSRENNKNMAEFNKTEHEGEDSNPIPGKDEQETPVEFPEKLKNEIQNMIS